jgi:hypothetical protein
MTTPTR